MNKELARVTDVKITLDREKSFLLCWVDLKYKEGSCQAFGGYELDKYNKETGRREGTAAGADYIRSLMEIFDVDSFDEIKGKIVYVWFDKLGFDEPIIGLELPEFDGGKRFMIAEWQEKWGYNK